MKDKHSITRREFLRLAAIIAGSQVLSACGPRLATPTVSITATFTPPASTADTRFYPAVPSRVVQTHHSGVWNNKTLVPGALRHMLDASITRLTGSNDARQAWASLFKPGEKIAIKVNTFYNSVIWTHMPLVMAVTDSLQQAGIPAETITIYDASSSELKTAGYTVNTDGPGLRCIGMDDNTRSQPTTIMDAKARMAAILEECDAIINIPVLKSHMLSGITFAMKNHYGSLTEPHALHNDGMRAIAALNALPEIKTRTRLIIGDALSACLRYGYSWPYWREDWIGDSIFMSYDPVAHDTLGLQLLTGELAKDEGDAAELIKMATPSLQYAAELGLGTNDPAHMDFIEQKIA